jgi:hypothetical protein
MKPTISGFGGRAPRRRNRGLTKDLVVLLQPADLRLEIPDLSQLLTGRPRPMAIIDLGLNHPASHRLLTQPLTARHHRGRSRQRRVLRQMLKDQPDATLLDLRINLLRHEQHPSNSERCGIKPGALQADEAELVADFERKAQLRTAIRRGCTLHGVAGRRTDQRMRGAGLRPRPWSLTSPVEVESRVPVNGAMTL